MTEQAEQVELVDEPQSEADPEPEATVGNVNGEVIDEALVNSWVAGVQYVNPADPDGPDGPENPAQG
jgi:hypothetical protein